MEFKSEKKFEKSILKFQFIVYSLSCCLLFILLYIVPIIIDFKINGYTSLLDQKDSLRSFAETPSEAFDYLLKNWLDYINPFSNYLVRFFIFTAIFGGVFELTRLSYNKLISKKNDI